MKPALARSAVLLLAALAAPPAFAGNLLTNGDFAANLAGWTVTGDVTFDLEDASGSPNSGSASFHPLSGLAQIQQCIATPFQTRALAAPLRYRIAPGSPPANIALDARYFESPDCTGADVGGQARFLSQDVIGSWRSLYIALRSNLTATSALVRFTITPNGPFGNPIAVNVDDLRMEVDEALFLGEGRFIVSTWWETSQGDRGVGRGVGLTGDSGYFWFFSPSNVEMITKVLNACGLNDRFWVFSGGLTDVRVVTDVYDTVFHTTKQYENPQGHAFAPLQDTNALPCH